MLKLSAFSWRSAKVLLVLVSLTASLLTASSVSADQLSDKQHQRDQLSAQENTLQAQIAQSKDQQAALQNIINGLDSQIAQSEQQVSAAQNKLSELQAALAAAQARLDDAIARLTNDKKELANELVLVYEINKESTTLNNLASSDDFNTFWQRLLLVQRIADSETAATNRVQSEEQQVQADRDQIDANRKSQVAVVSTLQAQTNNLQQQLTSRQAAQNVLQQVQANAQVQLAAVQQSTQEINHQIAQLQAEQAAAAAHGGGMGQFSWPEQGPITQGFGCTQYTFEIYDPSCPSPHRFHTGIDIAASGGTPVAAADSGIAHTFATSYGYGNYVIIDHGNGYSTLYGHLQSFTVGNGQVVGRGQIIGHEGSTGNSTGPHLHFGISRNGNWINPLAYLS